MSKLKKLILSQLTAIFFLATLVSWAVIPVPSNRNDFFLPGSQPGQAGQLQTPKKCDNCHGDRDQAEELAFIWRGSMMAQAARDPLFYASMAIANQDAPASGDLCIRCHSPAGWLEGRSEPTDGSAFNKNDREGVQCDFCHKLVKPSSLGVNPYPGDPAYTSGTYPQDQSNLTKLTPIPGHSANGMYIADAHNGKRGPFPDAATKHQMFYSPFHQDAALCGTCHDVSNPLFMKAQGPLARPRPDDIDHYPHAARDVYVPNAFGQVAPSFDPYTMFPVERTYSEWKMSAYNSPTGVYAPQFGGNKPFVSACQDCHMQDVTGAGRNKGGVPIRADFPLHDMTGGNSFIPLLVRDLYPAEADAAALTAGVERAIGMLRKAASLGLTVAAQGKEFRARVRVTNETGHKLPSGNPAGRRMWLNVRAYDSTGSLIFESGAYDPARAVLSGDAALEVYEIKPGISAAWAPFVGLPAGPSFHFALNNRVYKDNRIPPRGFSNANFEAIQSPVVGCTYADGQYWDETDYLVPGATALVVATLNYQTLSKEYVEFLRDENRTNPWGQTLYDRWAAEGKSSPVAMTSDTAVLQPLDTQAPSAPGNLVAQSHGASIDLTWSVSSDNVGVVRYDIFRDDVLLASTTTNQYADRHLPAYNAYSYCVKACDAAGNVSAVSNTATATTYWKKGPIAAGLEVTGPNPFNAATQFTYYLPESGPVEVSVFNLLGQKVATLAGGRQEAGEHRITWSAGDRPSGVYLVLFTTPTARVVQKVVLLK